MYLRMLDLALSYALDDSRIHQNNSEYLRVLREMHNEVLKANLTDAATVTLGENNIGFRGPAYDEPI